jgi:tRNA pseudouridine32 synthase/23S rRNA pseudouridine746 synthase
MIEAMHAPPAAPAHWPPAPPECLHADAHLLVAVKPAGELAVPGRGEAGGRHFAGRVQALWPDARVVHRLDMATSGLMLFARGAAAQVALSRLFEQRLVAKRYEAIVHGLPAADAGEVDLPLAADGPRRPRQQVDPEHGRPALTRWRVLARHPAAGSGIATTRLALQPVTGRSHQLRVHLLALGHPIVGDALYGPAGDTAPRLMLHACGLAFDHPADGRPMHLQHPAPF